MIQRRPYLNLVASVGTVGVIGNRTDVERWTAQFTEVQTAKGWTQIAKLNADDRNEGDQFGTSVALDGGTALIGATGSGNSNGKRIGAAYVFEKSGNGWAQTSKLTATDSKEGDQFGSSVSLDGRRAFIGAPDNDEGRGATYVFVREDGSWSQQTKIVSDKPSVVKGFGSSISAVEGKVLIGAPFADVQGRIEQEIAGAAYLFEQRNGEWVQQAKLFAEDADGRDQFGGDVALTERTALIGAPEKDTQNGVNAGAAYLFEEHNGEWNQRLKLTDDNGENGDPFGYSVVLNRGTALISAKWDEEAGQSTPGKSYAIENRNGEWSKTGELVVDSGDHFGSSISLGRQIAIVGAHHVSGPNVENSTGTAYVFAKDSGNWVQQTKLFSEDIAVGDQFGKAVSLSSGKVLIGAPARDGPNGAFTGSAYVFQQEDSEIPTETDESSDTEGRNTSSGDARTDSNSDGDSGPEDTTGEGGPGFGIISGLIGVGAAGYLLKRRSEEN